MNWVCYDCQPVERLLYGLQVQAGAAAAVGVGAAAAAGCVSPSNLRWAMHKATKLMHKLPSQLNYDCRRRRYATASCDAMTATRGVCEANEPLSLSCSPLSPGAGGAGGASNSFSSQLDMVSSNFNEVRKRLRLARSAIPCTQNAQKGVCSVYVNVCNRQ